MSHTPTRRSSLLVTLVAAASVAVTAVPAPAVAGGKDVAKGAALIALLAVGAALVQQNQAAQAADLPVTRAPAPRAMAERAWQEDRWQQDRRQPRPDRRDAERQSFTPRIPAVCAVEIGGQMPSTVYADSCLAREGFDYALPGSCAQTIRSRDWSGRVYDGACLRDAGFRTDRRW